AAYPGLQRPAVATARAAPRPCLALLRVGFTVPSPLPEDAVGSYPTVSPLPVPPVGPSAVCSLWHFPSRHRARALPGTLPCGARTFLGRRTGGRGPHSLPIYQTALGATSFPILRTPDRASRPPHAPGRSRTPNLWIRSPTLCPVELRARRGAHISGGAAAQGAARSAAPAGSTLLFSR